MVKNKIDQSKHLQEISTKTKWSTRKKVLLGMIIAAVVIIIIVIAVTLGVLLSRQSTSTTTTTQSTSVISIYWSLDFTVTDSSNTYNGTLINGASYFATSTTQPYFGYGRGLSLISSSSQYMSVLSPFIDLTYKSFTLEAWIYSSTAYSGDYGIFSQCQCSTCANQCLFFAVRGGLLYAGFTYNDLYGSNNITSSVWYHVAFVYNYQTNQQILYVNGYQDAIKNSANPYQGANGTFDIGSSVILSIRSYFNGYIDNVKLTTRAKSSSEILTTATLTAYYSFDVPSSYNDNGPNGLNGTSINTAIIAGRVNQAIRFTGSSSYFYAYGFYQVPYAIYPGRPYSVSLWINPSSVTSCTLIQFAYSMSNYACVAFLGIYSAVGVTGQIVASTYSGPFMMGPYVTIGSWTHVSVTYSITNGLSLYVNGVFFANSGGYQQITSNYITYIVLGYGYYCYSNQIPNGGFAGAVDEVYVHSRELSQTDVTALANP